MLIKRFTPIFLSVGETRLCWRIGAERTRVNQMRGVKDQRFARHRSAEEVSIQGLFGEVAWLKVLGGDYSSLEDVSPRSWMTDTFDARLANGDTFDVKTVMRKDSPIYVSCNKSYRPATYYLLMRIHRLDEGYDLPRDCRSVVFFEGAVHRSVLFRPCNKRTRTPWQRYELSHKRLCDFNIPDTGVVNIADDIQ